jgi:hypothetical protein
MSTNFEGFHCAVLSDLLLLPSPLGSQVLFSTLCVTKPYFYGEELLTARLTHNLEYHPLPVVRDCSL